MWAPVIRPIHNNNGFRQQAKRRLLSVPTSSSSSLSSSSTAGTSTAGATTAATEEPVKKGFLYRMAPPKGGTEPPDWKFMVIAIPVLSAGYYSWFIDPPKEQ